MEDGAEAGWRGGTVGLIGARRVLDGAGNGKDDGGNWECGDGWWVPGAWSMFGDGVGRGYVTCG